MSATTSDIPKSEQLFCAVVGDVVITYASWDTGYGPSYEVGLRQGNDFALLQNERFKKWNAEIWMRAIKAMLIAGISTEEIKRIL